MSYFAGEPWSPLPAPQSIVRAALLFEGGLAIVALAVDWLFGLELDPLGQIQWTAQGALQGVLAAVPLFLSLLLAVRFPVGPLKQIDSIMRELLVPLFRGCSLTQLLLISAMAGLGEELLFRGVVQEWTSRHWELPWLGIAVGAVLFGLAHPITSVYAVLAGLVGVYLGWTLVESDNLLVPILAHGAYDFAALVYLVRKHSTIALNEGERRSDHASKKDTGD